MKKWERAALTSDEVDQVINAGRSVEEQTMLTVLADTGMRVNELLRLRKDWVHWKKGVHGVIRVPIKEDYTEVPGTKARGPKTKRIRNVPMTLRLRVMLKAWFAEGHNGFFCTYNHVYNVCKRSGDAAGVCAAHTRGFHVTPHIFRHAFITAAWYKTDLRDAEIGQLVGHKDGKMVRERYLHIDEETTLSKVEESGWLDR